ncbi:MAG: DUF1549 domain-containing protein [Acidobacteriota bacterium]
MSCLKGRRNRCSLVRGLGALLVAMLFGGVTVLAFFSLNANLSEQIDYARQVQPILHRKCISCHNQDLKQAGLSLLTRAALLEGGQSGPAVIPGSSQESLLIQRITGAKMPRMPTGGEPLSGQEIAILSAWIDQGAKWNPEAAPADQPPSIEPRRPPLPETTAAAFENPVDALVAAYFRKRGESFPAPVSDALFVRRVYLDLWGLLPTPQQMSAFLRDSSPDKREQLIDRLLAHDQNYSQHWISYWNDLLRNDEGVIYHGTRESISRWLLEALEDNLPYDQFVSALLNPVREGDPRGFLLGVNWRGTVNASQTPAMQAAQNSAQVFLGVNLKCASCHDSFVNRWKLKDSYGMASLFSEEPLELVRCDKNLGVPAGPKFLFTELGDIEAGLTAAQRRAEAARLFTTPANGRFARTLVHRIWKRLFGGGLVEPVDEMENAPWDADLLDWLACDFVDHGYDMKFLLRRIMTSRAYQLPAVPPATGEEADNVFRGPLLRRLTAEQFVDGVSSVTGEWRVLSSSQAEPGTYSRDWRLKSTALTRALGRPIRDQVFTERNNQPTTLQALELVNGEELAYLIQRGAKRLLNELRPPPANLFDSGAIRSGATSVDIDISGAKELWLLIEDAGSYDPTRVVAGWAEAELSGPQGKTRLAALHSSSHFRLQNLRIAEKRPAQGQAEVRETIHHDYAQSIVTPLPSTLVYNIADQGYTRLRARVGVDESSSRSDINPRVRFFIFSEEPDRRQLIQVAGDPPVPFTPPENPAAGQLILRIFRHALGREPVPAEAEAARAFLKKPGAPDEISPEGLEDLLWSVFLSPEFQYI